MNTRKTTNLFKTILICLAGFYGGSVYAQQSMPEVLDTGTLRQQFDYLDGRTRIYNDFRAIREDMFQKIKRNSTDSLAAKKKNVLQLESLIKEQSTLVESLQAEIQTINAQLEQAIKNRDRMIFLGMPMHKILYNTILWSVIAALAFLLVILFLSNKRLFSTAKRNKGDLEELKEEFETYRTQTRIRQEELVVKHHNEIRKLKGK